jgi:glycosyltransferase involved in cell wall biosynthesis
MTEIPDNAALLTLDDSENAAKTRGAPATEPALARAPLYPDVGVLAIVMEPYGPQWLSRQQVLTRLARYFHVLWMNPAHEWRRAIGNRRIRSRETRVSGLPDSFVVYDAPGWLPVVYKPSWLGKALARARLRAASAALSRRGCRRIILYIWHVDLAGARELVPHDLSCYHIYDEYSDAEVEQPLDPTEERLMRSVDQVVTVSPTMFQRKGRLNSNSLQITNGVTYEAFAKPAAEPADLAGIPHPRLGYSGYLKKQLDWKLLLTLSSRHPEWSFVFVGETRPHEEIRQLLEKMEALPNVHFLGAKPSTELARYPQHFDVCLMPYRMNDYSKYIFPLKLYEYLAAGRPTLSIPLPALAGFGELVRVAMGVEEWEAAIKQLLEPGADTAEQRVARQVEARRHDWNVIVDELARVLARRLDLPVPRP